MFWSFLLELSTGNPQGLKAPSSRYTAIRVLTAFMALSTVNNKGLEAMLTAFLVLTASAEVIPVGVGFMKASMGLMAPIGLKALRV